MPAIALAFSISVPRRSSAWEAKFLSACWPRPKAFDEQHDAEGDPAAHQVEVAHGAGEQLAARPAVVEVHRQVLELLIQRIAQVRLDVGAGLQHEPATEPDHHRFENTEPEHAGDGPPNLARVTVLQRTIDQGTQHLRDEQRDEGRDER